MEMTAAYMRKAAEFFEERGFALAEERSSLGEIAGAKCPSTRFVVTRGTDEHLVLELVEHPSEGERYFLEIVRFHGLRSLSFPLDSWRFRGTSIELKYYALPDSGLGLALTLDLAAAAPAAQVGA